MTTKPKARKFRIRPEAPRPAPAPETAEAAKTEAPAAPAAQPESTEIDAIRKEALTGRQLRMARRVAQKHGLTPTSDFDAVRMLREKGIDPFSRAHMLELVVPEKAADKEKRQLPQPAPDAAQTLPSTDTQSPMARRNAEIAEIQRGLARRRRRKVLLLLTRLAFFVMLPTALAGYYFYQVATPMYSTKSEFMITSADNAGGGGLGSLLSGTPIASATDSIATQGYLQSKDAMLRLDRDDGFKTHFSQDFIDPIQRLDPAATNEETHKLYKKNVKIGYDPTEGIVRMEIVAADPETAVRFSERLISYAEERLNSISLEQRENQMADALKGYEKAEAERRVAQQQLVELQLAGATLDPEGVIASLRGQISTLEQQITDKEIELASLLQNTRPNTAKVDGARSTLDILNRQLADLNARMTDVSQGENSLAQLSVRMQMAQADLATRDLLLQSALQQVEQTRMEANRQVRYLNNTVRPLPSEAPSYPRAFENTILAFLIFAGMYLMLSLTAAILREQVTS